MSQDAKDSITTLLRLHQEQPGGKYHGLLLCIHRSRSQACKELQAKVASRVAGWKAEVLSQVGRAVLIQAGRTVLFYGSLFASKRGAPRYRLYVQEFLVGLSK